MRQTKQIVALVTILCACTYAHANIIIGGSVYGGGQMAKVNDSTHVTINSGSLGGDIFGGGEGALNDDGSVKASADVTGATYVTIHGGEFSVEADPSGTMQFKEHYNIYGGGNIASQVGNTHLYITRGLISNASDGTTNFLSNANEDGIAKVYYRNGQMYFSIFGGGYGKNTRVTGDTWLDFHITGMTDINSTAIEDDLLENQSYLDVIGGGFNGTVLGNTHVHVGGNAMCRNVYGGGLYATIGTQGQSTTGNTNVHLTGGNVDNVYGGGVMGDIFTSTNINIGLHDALTFEGRNYAVENDKVTVLMSVYGGNDVSGRVPQTNVYHNGGTIDQDLYGAGNGDYTGYYTPGLCDYAEGDNDNYFVVDHSGETSTDGKGTTGPKGDTYKGRPQTGNVNITIAGNDTDDKASVLGQVFGGGNSCTMGEWDADLLASKYDGNPHETRDDPDYFLGGGNLNITVGSHVKIGRSRADLMAAADTMYLNADGENVSGLFMGCSGRHLATQTTDASSNSYHHYYDAYTAKYWPGFAVFDNTGNPLSREDGLKSYNAYLNNILIWSDHVNLTIADEAEDIWLANFVGGGFRGSMKAKTASGRFAYTLPEGVTVGNAIVGGAYNTDVVYRVFDTESDMHTYTMNNGHYQYCTTVKPGWNEGEDYHHIEYAADSTITGIVRFYYDGGMLSHDNSDGRIHQVHADPRANAEEYATAYFEPLTEGAGAEDEATKAKLFTRNKSNAFLYLHLRCALEPEVLLDGEGNHSVHGGNVFGGCFMSGLVQGDSWVDYGAWLSPNCTDPYYFDKSNNMHIYSEAADLVRNNALNVFGAGYGEKTHTAGDTYLYVKAVAQTAGGDGDKNGQFPYMFNAFGGSYAGRVYGNTNVYFAVGKQGTLLGSLYGGGFKGDIDGNTFVELAEGFVTNVYGGSRQANIGGAAHVWAYDGKYRGIENANHLIICNLYGGNDIAGTIRGTMPAAFAATRWNALSGKNFNSYVEIASDDRSANRGFPLIGSAYASGNGVQWEKELGPRPEVGNALIEIDGGSTLRAFGGGNMATVTDTTYIFTDAHSTQFAKVKFTEYQHNIMQKVFFGDVLNGYTWTGDSLTMASYHVINLFGGNNVAEMKIQPQWNLLSGKLGSVYSGGNMGNMTYYNPDGEAAQSGTIQLNPKGLSISVSSDSIQIENLYGGCRLADVRATTYDAEGNATYPEFGDDYYGATVNVSGGRINNVYGGNDVAGKVYNGTNVNIDGAISGDVYGSGNGNYVYQYQFDLNNRDGKIEEHKHDKGYTYYSFRSTSSANSEAKKIQAINDIRPNVEKAYLNIAGSEGHLVYVKGNVYCGGNASTITGNNSYTKFDIGSYCVLNGVYMGSNGEGLTDETYLSQYREVNNFKLNTQALLQEYMNAVAMQALPRDFTLKEELEHAFIGTFCLGGNRGSMTTAKPVNLTIPAAVTIYDKIVGGCNNAYLYYNGYSTTGGFNTYNTDRTQPKITLDIYAKFLPRKMFIPDNDNPLYSDYLAQDFLYAPVKNPKTENRMFDGKYCNIYGGCYQRGDIKGDVTLNVYSDMLSDFNTDDSEEVFYNTTGGKKRFTSAEKLQILDNTNLYNETNGRPVFSVFGAGYGQSSVVYGNTHIRLLNNHNTINTPAPTSAPALTQDAPALVHPSANAIYGGGEAGKMIGTSTIHIADGTVYSNVVGGALAGNIYGNTEILVGYPSYYEVQKTGEYNLKRSNFTDDELAQLDGNGRKAVKQSIFLTKGDRINAAVYQAINNYGDAKQTDALQLKENMVQRDWNEIDINIRGAIYGGGYMREDVEDGQSAMKTTVNKFNSTYNLSTSHPELWTKDNTLNDKDINLSGEYAYGGNSTIWVQDEINAGNWANGKHTHITISNELDSVKHTGNGGIYGDGHSSVVAAFRSAAVDGYGYADHPASKPKLLNTFQRMDILQIRDCSMKMYGDIDVATGQNDQTLYAVSRISELMLVSRLSDISALSATNALNSRNVIDFYNPVHYLGSITSDIAFDSPYYDKQGNKSNTETYFSYKSKKIAENFDYQNMDINSTKQDARKIFGTRNEGTAKNLVRIDDPQGRGVHLKVVQEGNFEIMPDGSQVERSFYGPLSGIMQFELVNLNARGGGYVYTNNLHQQTIAESDATIPGEHPEYLSYLQTSGNIVFVPRIVTGQDGDDDPKQVYDDCYPTPYGQVETKTLTDLDVAHFWFVEGTDPTWCSYISQPKEEEVDTVNKVITITTPEELSWIYTYIDTWIPEPANPTPEQHIQYQQDYPYPSDFEGWTLQLGNDIDLSELTIIDRKEVPILWCPIADQKGKAFRGTFDGNGYKIMGMTINMDWFLNSEKYGHGNYQSAYDHQFGLFAKTAGAAIIKDVEMSDAAIHQYTGVADANALVGTLIASAAGTTNVLDCSVHQWDTIRVRSNKVNAVDVVSGLVGEASEAAYIYRNWNSGTITDDSIATVPVAGLVGRMKDNSRLEWNYSVLALKGTSVGGLVNSMYDHATLAHSYFGGIVSHDGSDPWGAIVANTDGTSVGIKHCYYDIDKNPVALGYRGTDAVITYAGTDEHAGKTYATWSMEGLNSSQLSNGGYGQIWASCYADHDHGHTHDKDLEIVPCEQDNISGEPLESAWNKGIWTFATGFYPQLGESAFDCASIISTFVMPQVVDDWEDVHEHFQLPRTEKMTWKSSANRILLDPNFKTQGDEYMTDVHLYLGGRDQLSMICDNYVGATQKIYITRQDINSPEDNQWFAGLTDEAKQEYARQLGEETFVAGHMRNKEVTNISKDNSTNGFDGDLHIWTRHSEDDRQTIGTVTNTKSYKVNGNIQLYTGFDNPYLWNEMNIPFIVAANGVSVHRTQSKTDYIIYARTSDLNSLADGGNFWLRSFEAGAETPYGGSTFQAAWVDPDTIEGYGKRPSVIRFPKTMKVDSTNYRAGDYWCYNEKNTIDGEEFTNGGSEIRILSAPGQTIDGTAMYTPSQRGNYGFIVYGNPTLGNLQLDGYYWTLETEKRDTTGVDDPKVRPEYNTDVAQWFSIQLDPVIPPLGIYIDGPEDFKEQALDNGTGARLMMHRMHEPEISEQFASDSEASFKATGYNGVLGVVSYIDQTISVYDVAGKLLYQAEVKANRGFTLNLPRACYIVRGSQSKRQIKVML